MEGTQCIDDVLRLILASLEGPLGVLNYKEIYLPIVTCQVLSNRRSALLIEYQV